LDRSFRDPGRHMKARIRHVVLLVSVTACGPTPRGGGGVGGGVDGNGDSGSGSGSGTQSYLVYAHSDSVLYSIDLATKHLVTVGNFNAPHEPGGTSPDVITDLAVAPNDTIYVISKTTLYTASPQDGH